MDFREGCRLAAAGLERFTSLARSNAEGREAVKFLTESLEALHMAAEEVAKRIRQNPGLQKERASLGLHIEVIRRLNAQLLARLQRVVYPDIRDLAIMPDLSEDRVRIHRASVLIAGALKSDEPALSSFLPRELDRTLVWFPWRATSEKYSATGSIIPNSDFCLC